LTKENAGINVALNKSTILKTVAQLGEPIISCLFKPIKLLFNLRTKTFWSSLFGALKPIGNSMYTGIIRSACGNARMKSILFDDNPCIFAMARSKQTLAQLTTGAYVSQ
jgi:hypothetical protein